MLSNHAERVRPTPPSGNRTGTSFHKRLESEAAERGTGAHPSLRPRSRVRRARVRLPRTPQERSDSENRRGSHSTHCRSGMWPRHRLSAGPALGPNGQPPNPAHHCLASLLPATLLAYARRANWVSLPSGPGRKRTPATSRARKAIKAATKPNRNHGISFADRAKLNRCAA